MRREYIESIIVAVVLAHVYSLVERWFDWSRVHEFFEPLDFLPPLSPTCHPYHYLFVFGLFFFFNSIPFWSSFHWRNLPFLTGLTLLTGLIEDAAYFYLYGEWVRETSWTAQLGYCVILGRVIPTWYFHSLIVSSFLISVPLTASKLRLVKR